MYGEEGIYTQVDYCDQDFTIRDELSEVKSLEDLKQVMTKILGEHDNEPIIWKSVMGCKFYFDSNIFYRDEEKGVSWALEPHTGFVYNHDPRAVAKYNVRFYVAKSLAEFVSRVMDEDVKWRRIAEDYIANSKPRMRSPSM